MNAAAEKVPAVARAATGENVTEPGSTAAENEAIRSRNVI